LSGRKAASTSRLYWKGGNKTITSAIAEAPEISNNENFSRPFKNGRTIYMGKKISRLRLNLETQ
jgi:hypothetical protein